MTRLQTPGALLLPPALLAGIGGLGIVLWGDLAWRQIVYPLELFGHEGVFVDHIRRLLTGDPIYGPPSIEFVPFLYTPGYYLMSAAFAWTGELAFVVPRGVSAATTLASILCLVLIVRQIAGSLAWGVAAAGAYAFAAGRVEGWYALAQVDSAFMMWLALAMLLASRASSARAYACVGLLFAAAFWCKQSGALAGVLFAGVFGLTDWRRAIAVLAGMALGIVPAAALLVWASDGWFVFYGFAIPAAFGQDFRKFGLLLRHDLPVLLPGLLAGLALVAIWWRRGDRPQALRWLAIGTALLGVAIAGRLHVGGHVNTLIPALWLMALALGAGCGGLWRMDVTGSGSGIVLRSVAWTLAAAQLALVADDLSRFRPAENGVEVAAQMRARLAAVERPILLPGMGYLIGEVAGADVIAVNDVIQTSPALREALLEEFEQAMTARRFRAVVLEDYLRQRYERYYGPYYSAIGPLVPDTDAQRPRAGLDFGPLWLLEAR